MSTARKHRQSASPSRGALSPGHDHDRKRARVSLELRDRWCLPLGRRSRGTVGGARAPWAPNGDDYESPLFRAVFPRPTPVAIGAGSGASRRRRTAATLSARPAAAQRNPAEAGWSSTSAPGEGRAPRSAPAPDGGRCEIPVQQSRSHSTSTRSFLHSGVSPTKIFGHPC